MFRNSTLTLLAILCLVAAMFAIANPTHADNTSNTIVVDTLDDVSRWEGNCSLRDAVIAATSNRAQDGCVAGVDGHDTIEFAPELQGGTIKLFKGELGVYDPLTVRGDVTIDAGYRSRIFKVANENPLTLENLTLVHGKEYGGGAIIAYQSDLTLRNVTMDRNQAEVRGGAVVFYGGEFGRLDIQNSTFTRNTSQRNSGAVYIYNTTANIYNSRFESNFADEIGGAIYSVESLLSTAATTYFQNSASGGGAIYQLEGTLVMQGDELNRNRVGSYGGGVMINGGDARILDSFFDTNSSRGIGAGIMIVEDGYLFLNGTDLQANLAERDGGGLYSVYSEVVTINASFTDNSAQRSGGGAYLTNSQVSMRSTQFLANDAPQGGGIYNISSDLGMIDSSFFYNGAEQGGGIFSTTNWRNELSDVSLVRVTMNYNTAINGAAIMNWVRANADGNSHVEVAASTLEANAGRDGTALFNHNASTLFNSNSVAQNEANAINNAKGDVTIWRSSLHTNQYNNCIGSINIDAFWPNQDSDGSCNP